MKSEWQAALTEPSKGWYRLDLVHVTGRQGTFFGSRYAELMARARNWINEIGGQH